MPDDKRAACRCGRLSLGSPDGKRYCGICLGPSQLRKLDDDDDWQVPVFRPAAVEEHEEAA